MADILFDDVVAPSGPFGITRAIQTAGGFIQVANNTARDAITAGRRVKGMRVAVEDVSGIPAVYRYDGATGVATNGVAWVDISSVVGAQTFTAPATAAVGAINVRTTGHEVDDVWTKPVAVFQASPSGAPTVFSHVAKFETLFDGDGAGAVPQYTRLNMGGVTSFDIAFGTAPVVSFFTGSFTANFTGPVLCTAFTATSILGTGNIAATGHITMTTAKNIVLATTGAGTMLGTGPTQLLGRYGVTPVVQSAMLVAVDTGLNPVPAADTYDTLEMQAAIDYLGTKIIELHTLIKAHGDMASA